MTDASPTICIVDDDASFRTAIGAVLSASGYAVTLCESARQLLEALLDGEPGCILLDVQMDDLSGPQLQNRLASMGCRSPIIFVSGHRDIPTTVQTIKAGADDFLTKPIPKEKLLAAITDALARYKRVRDRDNLLARLWTSYSKLTRREREVFALLVRGQPHKQIAHALGVSERTIKVHRHSALDKFQVQSLAELAVIAERLGMLPGPGRSPSVLPPADPGNQFDASAPLSSEPLPR